MFERILVPLDGSRASARALPYAIETAKRFNAEIRLLQVVAPVVPATVMEPTGGGMASPATNELLVQSAAREEHSNAAKARRYLQRKARETSKDGVKCDYAVLVGRPAESIIAYCEQEAIGLVVMTTSGKSGLKRALLGSVADRVIREPGFPVMAIRQKKG